MSVSEMSSKTDCIKLGFEDVLKFHAVSKLDGRLVMCDGNYWPCCTAPRVSSPLLFDKGSRLENVHSQPSKLLKNCFHPDLEH
jgi:hypothetical protein